jgi:hypothetical protein
MTRILHSTYRCKRHLISGICGLLGLAIARPSLSADKFDGVYGGKRVLTKGSASECPTDKAVSVTIRGQALTFTNSALRNFVMGFQPRPDVWRYLHRPRGRRKGQFSNEREPS